MFVGRYIRLNHKKQVLSALSNHEFLRLIKIFERKDWPIVNEFDDLLFDNFCNLLSDLEDNQRKLMLDLTEKFLWIKGNELLKCFSNSFNSFIDQFPFNGKKNIIICPLLCENGMCQVLVGK